ncbi:MAG: tetratricopeptide repeat protein [Anaerolineae bacterium]
MIPADVVQCASLRLARYYAHKLRQTKERLEQGGATLSATLNSLDQESAQIRHWQNYVAEGKGADYDRLLIDFALNALAGQQPFDEQMTWVQPAIAAAQRLSDQRSESALLGNLSHLLLRQGNVKEAYATGERALELAEQVKDTRLQSSIILRLGQIMVDSGKFDAARQYLERLTALGDFDMRSKLRVNTWLGYMAYCENDFELASQYIDENIQLSRTLGDLSELATALVNRGSMCLAMGQDAVGVELVRESITLQRRLGEKNLMGNGLQALITYYCRVGALAAAQGYADEHLTVAREIGADTEMVWAHCNLAVISRERGEYQRAHAYLLEEKAFVEQSGSLTNRVFYEYVLASVLIPLGQYDEARDLCRQLLTEEETQLLEVRDIAELHRFLAQIATAEGDFEQAAAALREALAVSEDLYDIQVTLYSALAETYLLAGDVAGAQQALAEVTRIEDEQESVRGTAVMTEARTVQAKLAMQTGDLSAAKSVLCDALQQVRSLEVIIPRLNVLIAALLYQAALGDARSVQVLSFVAHHSGTPHAQQAACKKQQTTLRQQFGSAECERRWELGKSLTLDECINSLLDDLCAAESGSS